MYSTTYNADFNLPYMLKTKEFSITNFVPTEYFKFIHIKK